MNRTVVIVTAAILSTMATASAQVTSPTPGQPGAEVAPGTPNSSDIDPNNPAASRDAQKGQIGTTGSGAPAASGSQNDITGPATKPAEKEPQRNDPTPDRQKNVQ